MNNDLAELTELNHDYVASVQIPTSSALTKSFAADFYCSNPDKSLVDRAAFLKTNRNARNDQKPHAPKT